jgi:hypothetical protein
MSFHVPEASRWRDAPRGYAWEHVSVHAWRGQGRKIQQHAPTWRENGAGQTTVLG